ncbi:N-acetyltransferase family protein [Streptomyces sp. NPDC001700]
MRPAQQRPRLRRHRLRRLRRLRTRTDHTEVRQALSLRCGNPPQPPTSEVGRGLTEAAESRSKRRNAVASVCRMEIDVLGTSNMYPNRPGPGSHIASGNFMVAPEARGRGVGQALGEYLLNWASTSGYAGVQFNAVAASNTPAVRLYEHLGFTLIGTVPDAFHHPALGRVGLHVMYHDLGA